MAIPITGGPCSTPTTAIGGVMAMTRMEGPSVLQLPETARQTASLMQDTNSTVSLLQEICGVAAGMGAPSSVPVEARACSLCVTMLPMPTRTASLLEGDGTGLKETG